MDGTVFCAGLARAVLWTDWLIYIALSFFSCCLGSVGSVLSASHLNAYGARHWRSLGVSQNYFDQFGVFVSVLLSLPMIVTSFVILIHAVVRTSNLLVVVKRKQLGIDKKQKAQHQAAAAAATAEATAAVASASSSSPTPASEAEMKVGDVDGDAPAAAEVKATRQRRGARKSSSKKK
jgi:hypothetical protein